MSFTKNFNLDKQFKKKSAKNDLWKVNVKLKSNSTLERLFVLIQSDKKLKAKILNLWRVPQVFLIIKLQAATQKLNLLFWQIESFIAGNLKSTRKFKTESRAQNSEFVSREPPVVASSWLQIPVQHVQIWIRHSGCIYKSLN